MIMTWGLNNTVNTLFFYNYNFRKNTVALSMLQCLSRLDLT